MIYSFIGVIMSNKQIWFHQHRSCHNTEGCTTPWSRGHEAWMGDLRQSSKSAKLEPLMVEGCWWFLDVLTCLSIAIIDGNLHKTLSRPCFKVIYVNSTMNLTYSYSIHCISDDSAPELALERPVGFETAHTWATDGITMVTKRWMLQKSVSKCCWGDGMDCACGWVPAFKQLHVHMTWQSRLGVE